MDIAFTTWVTPGTLRWHTRFFVPTFLRCLSNTPVIPGAKISMNIALYDLPDHICDYIAETWKNCPLPVSFRREDNPGMRRHNLMFRAFNRIAGLDPEMAHTHDYIISLMPTTIFEKDAIRDYLDSAVRMEKKPEAGAVVHIRGTSNTMTHDRNAIIRKTSWWLRCHEGITFRNVGKTSMTYDFFIHRSIATKLKMYLEDTAILYGLMMEGHGLYVRYYHQATTFDPMYARAPHKHMLNPYGRARGDNWDCKLNNGWSGAHDKEFFDQFLEVGSWQKKYDYIKRLDFKSGFMGQFYSKHEILKKQ